MELIPALSVVTADLLADKLKHAFKENDFSTANFQVVEDTFQCNLRLYDRVVSNALYSFQDYDLWDAWYRVWVIALLVGTTLNANLYLRYVQTKDKSIFESAKQVPYTGLLGSKFPESKDMLDKSFEIMDQLRAENISIEEAAQQIRELFKDMNYCPTYWNWDNPNSRSTPAFTVTELMRMYLWYQRKAPKHIREYFFHWRH